MLVIRKVYRSKYPNTISIMIFKVLNTTCTKGQNFRHFDISIFDNSDRNLFLVVENKHIFDLIRLIILFASPR